MAGGTWSTTQQTSRRTVDCSRFVGRQPEKLISLLALLYFSKAVNVKGYCIVVHVLAKSQKCGTKEVKRKSAEREVLMPAGDVKAAAADEVLQEAVKVVTGDGGGKKNAKQKESESMRYITKTFSGTGPIQSLSNGQLCTC